MDPKARRPWWKKKRWWAALVGWLVLMWPVSLGPSFYLVSHGWMPAPLYNSVFGPVIPLSQTPLGRFVGLDRWDRWWCELVYPGMFRPKEADPSLDPTINRKRYAAPEAS